MTRWLSIVVFLAAPSWAQSSAQWLTVVGDPKAAEVDTVEVDVASAVAFDADRIVKIRVNRAKPRQASSDGHAYRSYQSSVQIDCANRKARHRTATVYAGPLWTGESRVLTYTERTPQDMAFRDIEPNPRERIIKAACAISIVKSRGSPAPELARRTVRPIGAHGPTETQVRHPRDFPRLVV